MPTTQPSLQTGASTELIDPAITMNQPSDGVQGDDTLIDNSSSSSDVLAVLLPQWRRLIVAMVAGGALSFGIASLLPKVYTARATLLSQQQQNAATAALSSLGALAGLAGGSTGPKNPLDQYVALMQSVTVSDRIIDKFELMKEYDAELRLDAREELSGNVRISAGKKDGLITVDVDSTDPKKAAAMANDYVEQLQQMTTSLAVREAQQRREFFEERLAESKKALIDAQLALQGSGINQAAIKTEPRAAAEGYARLKSDIVAEQVKLQAMRSAMTERAPELQMQQALVSALQTQLNSVEGQVDVKAGSDYVSKYREFKYQETLFEVFARQYESARLDESREGALIQVVDRALAPERKSKPRRSLYALGGMLAGLLLMVAGLLVQDRRRASA